MVLCAVCALPFAFLSANFPVFIRQVREARKRLRQGRERLGYASQMDKEELSSWPWIILFPASVNDIVASRCSLFKYGMQLPYRLGITDTPLVHNFIYLSWVV